MEYKETKTLYEYRRKIQKKEQINNEKLKISGLFESCVPKGLYSLNGVLGVLRTNYDSKPIDRIPYEVTTSQEQKSEIKGIIEGSINVKNRITIYGTYNARLKTWDGKQYREEHFQIDAIGLNQHLVVVDKKRKTANEKLHS